MPDFPPDPSAASVSPEQPPVEEEEIDASQLSSEEDVRQILSEYWANQEADELWKTLMAKEAEFWRAAEARGLLQMVRSVYAAYFGLSNAMGMGGRWQTQAIQFAGEDGELLEFSVNEFRSFCDQIFNMTCRTRPAFQAMALNTDYDTLAQVEAADTTVQYYYEQVFGERKEKEAVRLEGLYGKSYTHIEWDPDGGAEIEIEDTVDDAEVGALPIKKKVHPGEFLISRLYWWQVICEANRSEFDGHLWRMLAPEKRSKWEMIARYPLYARQIRESEGQESEWETRVPGCDPASMQAEDMCSVRIFYHARTAAVPKGRKALFVNGILVDDGELPIDEIPIVDLCSCELHGTNFGISDLWNLLPLDSMQNQVLSDIATNVEAFGRPPLIITEGTDIDLDALANGQKVLFVPPNTQTPEPVKFPGVPDASFKILPIIAQLRQSLSGLNAISRGDTSANITSGAHAALYTSIAVDAQAPRAAALDLMRERVGNLLLQYLRRYALHPQLVAIAGVDERAYMKSFTRDDLAGVRRVQIKTQNPMMKTQSGRLQLAELLRDWPNSPLQDPQQIIELVVSGQLKPSYSATRVSKLRIRWENEKLLTGPPTQTTQEMDPATGQMVTKTTCPAVPVLMSDNASDHLIGLLEVMASPAAQENPAVLEACIAHMLEHCEIARNGDPYLAMLLKNPMPQSMMMGPDAAGGQSAAKPSDSAQKNAQETTTPPASEDKDDSMGARIPSAATPPAGATSLS